MEDMYTQQRAIFVEMEDSLTRETVKEELKPNVEILLHLVPRCRDSRFPTFRENTRIGQLFHVVD